MISPHKQDRSRRSSKAHLGAIHFDVPRIRSPRHTIGIWVSAAAHTIPTVVGVPVAGMDPSVDLQAASVVMYMILGGMMVRARRWADDAHANGARQPTAAPGYLPPAL